MRRFTWLLVGLLSCGIHGQVAEHFDRASELAAAGFWSESRAEFEKGCNLKTELIEHARCQEKLASIYGSRGLSQSASAAPPASSSRPAPAAPPPAVASGHPPKTPPTSAGRYLPGSPQPTAFAVIVGVERYDGLPSPTGAREDAEQMAGMFAATMGVPEANLQKLLDEKATKGAIESRIEWLRSNVPAGGRAYFYFSGHGAPEPSSGGTYIVPSDGDPRFLKQTGLLLSDLVNRLSGTRAKEVVVLLDACFSGAGGRSVLPPGQRPLVRVKEVAPVPNVAVYSAARGVEVSGPTTDGKSGLFSWYVLQALGRGEADLNADGQVSLQEMDAWVGPRVSRDATRANRTQTPTLVVGNKLGSAANLIMAWGLPSK